MSYNDQIEPQTKDIIKNHQMILQHKLVDTHQKYEKMQPHQLRKIEETLSDTYHRKWFTSQFHNDFYTEDHILCLRLQIDSLLQILNDLPAELKMKLEQFSTKSQVDEQNQFYSFSQNDQNMITRLTNPNSMNVQPHYFVLGDQGKEQLIKQMEIEIRTLRLQKIEADQHLKTLQTDYTKYQQQNMKLNIRFQKLQDELIQIKQTSSEQVTHTIIKQEIQQNNQYSQQLLKGIKIFLNRQTDQKSAHLVQNFENQKQIILEFQQQVIESQKQLNKQKLMNQELYAHIVRMQMPDEQSIYLKQDILKQIEDTRKSISSSPVSKSNMKDKKLIFSDAKSNNPDLQDRQWNRLIIEISRLKTDKRQMVQIILNYQNEQSQNLSKELLQLSQFLLNLFQLMDKPEFIINLNTIKNACAQQREIVTDRLIKLGQEQQQLQYTNIG